MTFHLIAACPSSEIGVMFLAIGKRKLPCTDIYLQILGFLFTSHEPQWEGWETIPKEDRHCSFFCRVHTGSGGVFSPGGKAARA
jgi:hypothetical protein